MEATADLNVDRASLWEKVPMTEVYSQEPALLGTCDVWHENRDYVLPFQVPLEQILSHS